MHLLIATDSFKDALAAEAVCQAIERGWKQAAPDDRIRRFPLADGGEGTAEILTRHAHGQTITIKVKGPLFDPVEADYGLSADQKTAFIDMAQASGLQLVPDNERDPLKTTTYGTGQLIADAVDRGVEKILLGIGGSATNDCGTGMAAALGYRFLDDNGNLLAPTGENLRRIARIDDSDLRFTPGKISVEVMSDVDNPLYGYHGAAYTYAPQKGADNKAVEQLDRGLRLFSNVLAKHFGFDVASTPGAGAAGGMGAGTLTFLQATLRPGIDAILDHTRFNDALAEADLLLTGEGKIDAQTAQGKLIQGLCRRAAKANVPVIALCGTLEAAPEDLRQIGLRAAFSILQQPVTLREALEKTEEWLEATAYNVACLTR